MADWKSVLELDSSRRITGGSERQLCEAIRQGSDLRIYTEFRHNEHIEPGSSNREIVREMSDFPTTYLVESFGQGRDVKVAVRGVCRDLGDGPDHEVFVRCGPCYYNTERKLFSTGTRPMVRVKPGIPMRYESRGWDFGWLMVRSDGFVARWLCDPYTLQFNKSEGRYAVRWFVR